jgi:hypothetical protein
MQSEDKVCHSTQKAMPAYFPTPAHSQNLSVDCCRGNNSSIRKHHFRRKRRMKKTRNIERERERERVSIIHVDVVYHEHQPGALNRGSGAYYIRHATTRCDRARHDKIKSIAWHII